MIVLELSLKHIWGGSATPQITDRGLWVQINICCKKIKIEAVSSANLTPFQIFSQNPPKTKYSFGKLASNFTVAELFQGYRLSTPREVPRPLKSPIGGLWVQINILWKKIKNQRIFEVLPHFISDLLENPQKSRYSFSKSPSKFWCFFNIPKSSDHLSGGWGS